MAIKPGFISSLWDNLFVASIFSRRCQHILRRKVPKRNKTFFKHVPLDHKAFIVGNLPFPRVVECVM